MIRQPDEPADERGEHALEAERDVAPTTELEHERRADERNTHQRSDASRTTGDRGRPDERAQALERAEPRSGGDAEMCRRCFGSHRRPEPDGEDDRDARGSVRATTGSAPLRPPSRPRRR